jgi:hypothetical protein
MDLVWIWYEAGSLPVAYWSEIKWFFIIQDGSSTLTQFLSISQANKFILFAVHKIQLSQSAFTLSHLLPLNFPGNF